MTAKTLKKILIERRGHKCEMCKLAEWMGQPIPIQMHHIDGNTKNNLETNGQLLCHNCHALTPNYGCKNIKIKRKSPQDKDDEIKFLIPKCTSIREVLTMAKICCCKNNYDRIRRIASESGLILRSRESSFEELEARFARRKVERPTRDELKELVWNEPVSSVAKRFGVSGKAVEKWCRISDIKTPPRGYWQKLKVSAIT